MQPPPNGRHSHPLQHLPESPQPWCRGQNLRRARPCLAGFAAKPMAELRGTAAPGDRNTAVDVLRGLVVLLLVPDPSGGFSFHRMAELHPDSVVWSALGRMFSHVAWEGVAVWDLVMPVFAFVIGVAMPLSQQSRRQRGAGRAEVLTRVVLRSATLVVLGLLLVYGVKNVVDELILLLVLATGLPVVRAMSREFGTPSSSRASLAEIGFGVLALAVAVAWMVAHPQRLYDLELHQILILIGLAYLPAFLLQSERPLRQALAAFAVILGHATVHTAYAVRAGTAVAAGDVHGWLAAGWVQGDNAAVALDRWLLNLLPRAQPYVGNFHDYHTLQFVPLIAVMLAGALVGRAVAHGVDGATLARRCAAAAAAGLLAAWALTLAGIPLVKSLWTPSWTILATSVCLLSMAVLLVWFDGRRRSRVAELVAVLGANALLLYVLASAERWRIVKLWQPLFEAFPGTAGWRPLLEALLVLLTLWVLAWVLYKRGLLVRV